MKKALILLALMLCWAGCNKTSPPAASTETSQSAAPQPQPAAPAPPQAVAPPAQPEPPPPAPATNAKATQVEQPPPGMKVCFECGGTGEVKCNALGCKDGWVDCPGDCLKLSVGDWQHMHFDGHSDAELWRIFTNDDGSRVAVGQDKVGDVMELQDGKWVDTGKCKVCGGTGKIKCTACNGTGKLLCPVCEGKKFVPEQWTAFNNPKLPNPPKTFHLKNGTTVFGKLEGQVGSTLYIRTEDGKQVTLESNDLAAP